MPLKEYPDHRDAELVLKLYELRREAVMRESRRELIAKFLPTSLDDVMAVARPDHPLNAAFRQVASYWEMAYAFARHGVVNADFMLEANNGEGLLIYTRIEPWLDGYREQSGNPVGFRNAEWVANETHMGRMLAERFRKRVQAHLAAHGKA